MPPWAILKARGPLKSDGDRSWLAGAWWTGVEVKLGCVVVQSLGVEDRWIGHSRQAGPEENLVLRDVGIFGP